MVGMFGGRLIKLNSYNNQLGCGPLGIIILWWSENELKSNENTYDSASSNETCLSFSRSVLFPGKLKNNISKIQK